MPNELWEDQCPHGYVRGDCERCINESIATQRSAEPKQHPMPKQHAKVTEEHLNFAQELCPLAQGPDTIENALKFAQLLADRDALVEGRARLEWKEKLFNLKNKWKTAAWTWAKDAKSLRNAEERAKNEDDSLPLYDRTPRGAVHCAADLEALIEELESAARESGEQT